MAADAHLLHKGHCTSCEDNKQTNTMWSYSVWHLGNKQRNVSLEVKERSGFPELRFRRREVFCFFLLFRSHLNKKMANPVSQQHLIFHIAQRFCHALGLLQTNIQLLLNLYSEIISFSLSHHPEKSLSCPRIFNTRHPNLNSSTVIRYSFKCFFHHVSKSIKSIESSPS